MSWSREQVSILIEEYKKYPCLYAIKDARYKNKHARATAIEAIKNIVVKIKPGVSTADIKTKFHGLRTNFLNEHRKYKESLKSGAGEDDIYVPSLWYYDQMDFLVEHCCPRLGIDAIEATQQSITENDNNSSQYLHEDSDTLPEGDLHEFEVGGDNVLIPVSQDSSTTMENYPIEENQEVKMKKKKVKHRQSSDSSILQQATGTMKIISDAILKRNDKNKSERDEFAEFIAAKRKKIHPTLMDDVEEQILKILYDAIRASNNINKE